MNPICKRGTRVRYLHVDLANGLPSPELSMRRLVALLIPIVFPLSLRAADWPQWMGPNRDGVWPETGILREFPKDGPKVEWRTEISAGYSGPAVADGRVFVADRVLAKGARNPEDPFDKKTIVKSTERVLCLDAANGKVLWKHEYECPYQISFPAGPRCTPTVNSGKVYSLGAMGDLYCLDAATGKVVWTKNFPRDYNAQAPTWGFCGHPLVYKDMLICVVGGQGSVAVAFEKETGNEKWKNLTAREPGYSPPTLITSGGKDQIAIWHGQALNGLDPFTGKEIWSVGLEPAYAMSIMAPRQHGDMLFAAGIGGAGVVEAGRRQGDADLAGRRLPGKRSCHVRRALPGQYDAAHREGDHLWRRSTRYAPRRRTRDGKKLWFNFAGNRERGRRGLQERRFRNGLLG